MDFSNDSLEQDIERINRISIIPTILNVVCQTTGMGFAAVARVTEDRWIACSVRDDINFGLAVGGELKIETTICNEIRDSHQAVVINNVPESEIYRDHHTPLLYGFKSYISFPIFLKTGEFFGTLCAIDPNPAQVENEKVMGMFSLFTDLIAFHLQQIEVLEQSDQAVRNLNQQLTRSKNENRQYRQISNHNLQEPLRKLQLFSSLLIENNNLEDSEKTKEIAAKIFVTAQKVSSMIKELTHFSGLNQEILLAETINVNALICEVWTRLSSARQLSKANLQVEPLPSVYAVRLQIEQLFYFILDNSIKFAKKEVDPVVRITGEELTFSEHDQFKSIGDGRSYLEIRISDNGIGIEPSQLEKIFDMFSQVSYDQTQKGDGFGLTFSRKIVHQHGGLIKVESEFGMGTTVILVLPLSDARQYV